MSNPKLPKRAVGRRYSPEAQQEKKSLGQIQDCFSDWLISRLSDEVGEDLRVQVFDDGQSTGLSFDFQVKSTTELSRLLAENKTKSVSYRLKVADLEHWEDAVPSVVVLRWDIERREGRWQDVPAIIEGLQRKNPKWRFKKRVTVGFPQEHTTDEAGRARLRHRVAELALPLVADKELEIAAEFSFPAATEEGRRAFDALMKAIDEGEPTTVKGEHIVAFKPSPWWERRFGKGRKLGYLTITPGMSGPPLRVRLVAAGPDGSEDVQIELRRTKGGLKKVTFDNTQEAGPIQLKLVADDVDTQKMSLSVSVNFSVFGRGVAESMRMVRFYKVLHAGGQLSLCDDAGKRLGDSGLMRAPSLRPLDEVERIEVLLRKLGMIEAKLGRVGDFSLRDGMTGADQRSVEDLYSICTTGRWEQTLATFTFSLDTPPKLSDYSKKTRRDGELELFVDSPEYEMTLLGVRVPVGDVRGEFTDKSAVWSAFEEAAHKGRKKVALKSARVAFTVIRGPLAAPETEQG